VFMHAEWMLKVDQTAVQVFTSREPSAKKLFKPRQVLEFIKQCVPVQPFFFACSIRPCAVGACLALMRG
jgi:hypothetical protein